MKLSIYLLSLVFLLCSCGEKKGGKRRKGFYPRPLKEESIIGSQQVGIRKISVASLKVSSEGIGIIEESRLKEKVNRYLRDKVLSHAFLNLTQSKSKDLLEVEARDEYRYYPGEISVKSKMNISNRLEQMENERGSWLLKGSLNWKGLKEEEVLSGIVIGLASVDSSDLSISSYGSDLLRGINGLALTFNKQKHESLFQLSFSELPANIIQKLVEPHSNMLLEINDFQVGSRNMEAYLEKIRKDKVRLIISTPEGERFYFLKQGESFKDVLKKIDSDIKFNFRGNLKRFLSLEQDEMFSLPDRNIMNNISLYNDKKVWWSNVKGSLSSYEVGPRTIVLAFSNYHELRETRLRWSDYNISPLSEINLSDSGLNRIAGRVIKRSVEYKTKDYKRQVLFEIGTKKCLENRRFERKGADCYTKWRTSFVHPVGSFRKQLVLPSTRRLLNKAEVILESGKIKKEVSRDGYLDFILDNSKSKLVLTDTEKPKTLNGGFIGWASYDSRLSSYQTRVAHENLSTFPIKKGFLNIYEFKGWKKVYIPVN